MSPGRLALLCALVVGGCARQAHLQSAAPAPTVAEADFRVQAHDTLIAVSRADSSAADTTRSDTARTEVLTVPPGAAATTAVPPFTTAPERADQTVGLVTTDRPVPDSAQVYPSLSLDPYANHDLVQHYLKLFTGTAKSRMGERLSAGTRYNALIRDKLRASGIPEEITYLALVESGYDPHAYSSAAAVGMWQFMSSTARDFGLRVDWWIDERRDPVRATDAAIRYLNELRAQFGSIYLAAAAYNGGAGRVSRGLSRLTGEPEDAEPDDRFFALASTKALRPETRDYVPQLIAAALVGREPLTYGIAVDTQPAYAYDSVAVPPATALGGVARACAAELSDIRDLNGQILRGMTPPDGAKAWLRVPPGCAERFADVFDTLDSGMKRGATSYATKKGDTPSSIAKKAGITVTVLRRYNPKIKSPASTALSAGQKILIPTKDAIRASREVPDPSIERYGGASGGSYVVRRGDTLGSIAQHNGLAVTVLKRMNGLKSDRIVIGQKLRVRG